MSRCSINSLHLRDRTDRTYRPRYFSLEGIARVRAFDKKVPGAVPITRTILLLLISAVLAGGAASQDLARREVAELVEALRRPGERERAATALEQRGKQAARAVARGVGRADLELRLAR